MDITVFLGAPGSGKGTQAKRLTELGFQHLSTGDLLRAAIEEKTAVGLKAKSFIDKGELVPDHIMIDLIADVLKKQKPSTRVILDGFPRTLPQAEALDAKAHLKVARVIYLDVPEERLVARLTGRRICSKCGAPFHLEFSSPKNTGICDHCQGELKHRSDDTEVVVRKRLDVYNRQTTPLLDYYRRKNKLFQIDGDRQINQIMDSLLEVLHGSA